MHDLLERCSDPHEKLWLLNHYLDMFKGTLFRQTMFAEFEKITHEKTAAGETLNAQSLCQIYGDLNTLYFGPDMVNDPEISLEWAEFLIFICLSMSISMPLVFPQPLPSVTAF